METTISAPLRSGQAGDICILLEPNDPLEISALHERQLQLQRIFGGQLVEPVHITCQCFALADEKRLPQLIRRVAKAAARFEPFQIQAHGLVQLYSDFRHMQILKWEIPLEPNLVIFSALLEKALATGYTKSNYAPNWVPNLITALEDINSEQAETAGPLPTFPHHLFTPAVLSLSRLKGPSQYEILEKFTL